MRAKIKKAWGGDKSINKLQGVAGILLLAVFALASEPALANREQDALSEGNTAWLLMSTALVLFMTLPGLALFYGGLVRSRNVLSVLMNCFAIACMASVLWLVVGYSLAFGDGGAANACIGGVGRALGVQLVGLLATAVWAGVLSFVIIKVVAALVGLRVSADDEAEGLDITAHGERGYEI